MKKRLLAGLLAAAMLTGLGSVVFAVDDPVLGTAEVISGGTADNTTDPRTVTIIPDGELTWYSAEPSIGRSSDNWWVGFKMIAPSDVTLSTSGEATVTYTRQMVWESEPSASKPFDGASGNWDGKLTTGGWMQAWIPVQPWYFDVYGDEEGNLTAEYVFTWAADRTQTFKVIIPNGIEYADAPVIAYKDGEVWAGFASASALASPNAPITGCAFEGEGITVSKVTFEPTEAEITKKVGDEVELSAKGYFTQSDKDFEVYNPEITWEIKDGNGSDATSEVIDGILTLAEGDVGKTLTVTPVCVGVDAANITGSLKVTVEKADDPVYAVTATAEPASVERGKSVQLTVAVTATPEDASTDGTYAWTVKKGEEAVTGLTVAATANPTVTIPDDFAAGDYTFTVTFTPTIGVAVTNDVLVKVTEKTVTPPPADDVTLKSITVSPATATVEQGKSQTFTVTATGSDDKPFELPKLIWDLDSKTSSIKDGVLTVAKDEAAATLTVTAVVDGNSAIFASATITVTKAATDNPGTTPSNPGSSSSGSGSSGGGSSSGSSTAAKPAQTATVTEASAVTQTTKAVAQAIAQAEKADADTATATVKVQNAKSISAKVLESMVKAAEKAAEKKDTEVNLVLHADVVKNGKVESRLYIDPTKATLKSELKLGVTLGDQKVENKFDKYFENKITVVKFDQVGTFGMNIKAAVKADLKGMNTRNLHFYSYDAKTNRYVKLVNPKYWVDANGYLHFTTSQGNYVVVTDAPLVRK